MKPSGVLAECRERARFPQRGVDFIFAVCELLRCGETIPGDAKHAPQQSELFCRLRRLSAYRADVADPRAAACAFPGLDRVVDGLLCRYRGLDLAGIRHSSWGAAPDSVLCHDA